MVSVVRLVLCQKVEVDTEINIMIWKLLLWAVLILATGGFGIVILLAYFGYKFLYKK